MPGIVITSGMKFDCCLRYAFYIWFKLECETPYKLAQCHNKRVLHSLHLGRLFSLICTTY